MEGCSFVVGSGAELVLVACHGKDGVRVAGAALMWRYDGEGDEDLRLDCLRGFVHEEGCPVQGSAFLSL